ncbi:hypothetical protein PSPO01_15685 [Paraphaeosphaeria sporulosa]
MNTREIPSDVANDDKKLKGIASEEFGFDESSFDVSPWTNYYADEVPEHTKDRLVVFKAPDLSDKLGCIRVRDKDDIKKTVWDVVGKKGPYLGFVPAGSLFEAMVVDVKLITPK